ncbi:MAG: hypothetical protein ACREQ5_07635 [Candidatus Dormibacteria bacterium]
MTGRALNPSTTITAVTANTGDSFTINNFDNASPAYIDQIWGDNATGGQIRVRSPRMHDMVQGIRVQAAAAKTGYPLLDSYADQLLYASDILTVETSGGASETDNVALLNYYTNLPGASQRLASWAELSNRIVNLMGSEVDTTSGTTAGDWGAGTAINATFDNFKANTDYALLGYTTNAACTAVAIAGADTSNFRVGGPGVLDPVVTRDWFIGQNVRTGRPYIPVINSNNRGGTLAYVAATTASTAVKVSLLFAQLSS